ncbi:hypothetical protein CMUS01_07915 [Colletotrichum musicola]|uniref:Uncharacterized protein n=1 Tax=Colletotrichum musicola TaxID=2175873 RepID=A0A8H6KFZ3_9PEZI|nr:hypothetical protein CMUS01_07915 [Colletotrichum musicola]
MYSRPRQTPRAVPISKERESSAPMPRKSCLKSARPAGRSYLGCEPGGMYYEDSQEAETGVPRQDFIRSQQALQVERYKERMAEEDALKKNYRHVPRRGSAPRTHPSPGAVRFTGETTYIYQPDRILAETPDYLVIGFAISKLTEHGMEPFACRFRRPVNI